MLPRFPAPPRPQPPPAAHSAPATIRQSPAVHYTFLLIGFTVLVYALHKLAGLLLPLLFAGLLAVLLLPLVARLERRRWPRVLAIVGVLLLVVLVLLGVFYLFGVQLVSFRSELPKLQTRVLLYFAQMQEWAQLRFGYRPISEKELLDNTLSAVRKSAGGFLGSTLSTTAAVVSVTTLVPIYIFCFLYYRDHIRQFLFRFVKPDRRTNVLHTFDNIKNVVQGYMQGLFMVIVLVSIFNAIGLLALDVHYAIFFAVFASVLAVIPYIGILVGSAVPALFTLVETGSPSRAAAVVGVFLLVQFLEGNFITPMITGSKVSINPMAAIIALILGGELWGTPGMILSIPLTAVLKVVFDASKATEPWGFLLGDITDGEIHKKKKPASRGLYKRLRRLMGR